MDVLFPVVLLCTASVLSGASAASHCEYGTCQRRGYAAGAADAAAGGASRPAGGAP